MATRVQSLIEGFRKMDERARRSPDAPGLPVIVEGRLFSHVIDAAYWLAVNRPQCWENMAAVKARDTYRIIRNLTNLIKRRCDAYGEGQGIYFNDWFWAEEGAPTSWKNIPRPWNLKADWEITEDLRRK